MEEVIIAVDAGGTKTKFCVMNHNLDIIHTHMEGCGSPAVLGLDAINNIHRGLVATMKVAKEKYKVVAISMGISGLGVIKDKFEHINAFEKEFKVPVVMENDAVLALHSIVTDQYEEGVLVLSGTGSAILGIKNLETRLIGGWGHLLTEAGSSYSVVRDLICNLIHDYENKNVISPLGTAFMKKINIEFVDEFKVFFYQNTKKDIASYSRFISEMASEGNKEAINLLIKSGEDLAVDVKNAYNALNLSSNAVLGFRGGFIRSLDLVKDSLINKLKEFGYNPVIVEGYIDPIYGAYYMAKRYGVI